MKMTFCLFVIVFAFKAWSQDVNEQMGTEIQQQVIEQEDIKDDISKEKASAAIELKKAEKLAETAKIQAEKAESETERALAAFLSSLQSYRAEALNTKLKKVKSIEQKVDLMREKTRTLKLYEDKIKNSPSELNELDLQTVSQIWRDIVDETVSSLFFEDTVEINSPPEKPSSVQLTGEKFEGLKLKIKETLDAALNDKHEIEAGYSRIKRAQRDVSARLLLNSGRVRAGIMQTLISRGLYSVWDFSSANLTDYAREIKIVPYRFVATFAEKYFDFKLMSQEGLRGWLKIAKQALLLLLVFLLPVFLFKVFKLFSSFLDNLRKQIFTTSQMNLRKRTRFALWIGRLNPYLPWLFAYITIKLSYSLLAETLLDPFIVFLPYLNIYVLYRGFLILFSAILAKTLLSKNLDKLRSKQPKVQATAIKLSMLFFGEWAFLHATEDTVRQALIYNLIFDAIVFVNLAIVAFEARLWREELLDLSKKWLNVGIYARIEKMHVPLLELFIFPLLFLGNLFFLLVGWGYQWVGQFEVGKKISSEIFKRRLEDAASDRDFVHKDLDEDYRSLFLNTENLQPNTRVQLSRSPLQKCINTIEDWKSKKSHEDLILLYGNFGIGKTTLLSSLEQYFQPQLKVLRKTFKSKITSKEGLLRELSSVFDRELKTTADIEFLDGQSEKTLVVLDDIHNLYLNTTNGLEAYRTLIELTSLQFNNIFWCLSCNERALAHLNGLFGANHFIGSKIELLSWTDSEVQDLILKRHKQSKFKLRFDQVISAVHRGDILEASSGLEVQFFRLLWGQSRGNPSTAQELWLSAAFKESENFIRISVPEFTSPRTLAGLGDETLMVYAAIVKHENLSFIELEQVSELPLSSIRQALKFGEDGMIISQSAYGRWRIHPKAQYVVHAQLIGRNFIYG